MRLRQFAMMAASLAVASSLVGSQQAVAAEPPSDDAADAADWAERLFATDVWPLLERKCLACHGNDPADLKGKLDLRSRRGLLAGGESAEAGVVPGDPRRSLLYRAVRWEELEMPPKENDRLSDGQVESIRRWIAGGAPWPDSVRRTQLAALQAWESDATGGVVVKTSGGLSDEWTNRRYRPEDLWAYQPIQRPRVPRGASRNTQPPHPIDAFIEDRLRREGIAAASPADRQTLLRRLSYDLTGLPPSADELNRFLKDKNPRAFDRLVDRLLSSKHYGERMAQHWLDVVRYADTNGFSRDEFRPDAWKYRDWVVRALNEDLPYDEFVRQQITGDELTPAQSDATGFLWMGPWEHTSMSVAAVTRQQWLDDVTNSVGVSFLGHELRCARCHDHKFDPIPTRDYYRMQAVFASTAHSQGGGNYQIRARSAQPISILRGGSLENTGPRVEPGFLSAIAAGKMPRFKARGRRLELANWITSDDNPLTARVIVNRVWQMHFGSGLVATPNNFGKTGARPTHPELLDWLAAWLIEHDWSLKKLHRLIVTSRTYQRSGQPLHAESVARVDPDNRLLSYFPPRRLTAEEIRDSLLALSGELNPQVGGPSVYPEINWEVAFQPRLLMGKLAPPYQPSPRRAERNRRTLYAVRIRGLRDPLLETFNQPGSELSCERREQTTVAPQALSLLHGEFVQKRALALAARICRRHDDPQQQVEDVFLALFGKRPAFPQRQVALAHVARMSTLHAQRAVEPRQLPRSVTLENVEERTGRPTRQTFELKNLQNYEEDLQAWDVDAETRALADLCVVLFNSSQFLYIY